MSDFTFYLLRDDVSTPADALEHPGNGIDVSDGSTKFGTLYVKPSPAHVPKWASFFAPIVPSSVFGMVQSTSAVFIVEEAGRQFALAFGQGRHLLKPGVTEERFGLLVVLNLIESNELRSMDTKSFETVDKNSRIQTSQNSTAAEFGIDVERDLLRGMTASPKDTSVGRRLTGAEALNVSIDLALKDLPVLLGRYLSLFNSTNYKKTFDWVDNIAQVPDKSKDRAELDRQLLASLEAARVSGGRIDGTWMALPEVIDWSRACRFRFSGLHNAPSHSDIHLPGFFESLDTDDQLSIELLQRRTVCSVDDAGIILERWTVYRCMHCELSWKGSSYVLSDGHWYRVKPDFEEVVDAYFDQIPRHANAFIDAKHDSEAAYNIDLCDSDPARLALMDCKNISVGGVHDKVEFCDVYTSDRCLIHVKRYGSSSVLGHLFNQGLVSGTLLKEHSGFVKKVNEKLPKSHKLPDSKKIPRDVSGFRIVFAIISESKDPLKIPFFARVTLRHAHRQLIGMNFGGVELAKIQTDDTFAKTQKLKSKGPSPK